MVCKLEVLALYKYESDSLTGEILAQVNTFFSPSLSRLSPGWQSVAALMEHAAINRPIAFTSLVISSVFELLTYFVWVCTSFLPQPVRKVESAQICISHIIS